jgi:small subunit ribosomal protein S8
MMTDPIADMLMRIRNASKAKHARVDVPSSKLKVEVARLLKEEGFIASYKLVDDERKVRKDIRIFLKYTANRRSIITGLKRVSRPGARVYVGRADIRPVVGGLGASILSTPKGLMTGRAARKAGIGGELLCEIW